MDVTLFRIKGYISEAASKMDALPSSIDSKSAHCLFLHCFVIAALKDTLGARCCLQAGFFFFCHKKRINFFLPFPFSSPISNCHESELCFYTTFHSYYRLHPKNESL